MHKFIRIELRERLAAYPPEEANFGIAEIVVNVTVVNQPLNCFQPTPLDMRPPLNLLYFLPVTGHRTADAADAGMSLVVEFAVRNAVHVQELPHISLRPMDDGRDKYLVLPSDTRDHLFLVLAPLVESFLHAPALNVRADFISLSPPCALLLAYSDKRHFPDTARFLELGAAPAEFLGRRQVLPLRHLVDAHARLYQLHIRILRPDKADDFRRVDAGEVHVRLRLHASHPHEVVQALAVLASGKRVVESVLRV